MSAVRPLLGVECPCGCGAFGPLTKRDPQHSRGCRCASDTGRRNRSKGQRGQRRAWRALGGTGRTPSNEEWGRELGLHVWIEVKTGEQVPAKFRRFVSADWFRRALNQARAAMPVGVDARPAVYLVLPEREGEYLIVPMRGM